MFRDLVTVKVRAGRGGNGCVSFLRMKFNPKGGPSGGDGGNGGNIIIKVNPSMNTLSHLAHLAEIKAESGKPGGINGMTGKTGKDKTVFVPAGTIIKDVNNDIVLKSLDKPGETLILARGGRAGKGNKRAATSTHQSPRHAQPGEPGEELYVCFELKLIADFGLVGLPNAGKSTLLSVITNAKPKIAAYPFTTLAPLLGTVIIDELERFTIADLPGIAEDAHRGRGLGLKFLRHIERTRAIIIVVDCSSDAIPGPEESYKILIDELRRYKPELLEKPRVVVGTKADLPGARTGARKLSRIAQAPINLISSQERRGLRRLIRSLAEIRNEKRSIVPA